MRKPIDSRRLEKRLHRVVERRARRLGHDAGGQDDHRESISIDEDVFAVGAHAHLTVIDLFVNLKL